MKSGNHLATLWIFVETSLLAISLVGILKNWADFNKNKAGLQAKLNSDHLLQQPV